MIGMQRCVARASPVKVTPPLRACVCPHAVDGGGVGRLALLAAAAAAFTIINI